MCDLPVVSVMCPGEEYHYSDIVTSTTPVCNATVKWALESIDKINVKHGEAFVICDYGADDGGASIVLLKKLIDHIRKKYGRNQEVHVIYEDQAMNNYNSLFQRMHGTVPGCISYFRGLSNVYVTACATGFYQQCLPSGSVHLGISSLALHWLSEKPCNIPDTVFHYWSGDAKAKAVYKEQAAKDWQQILVSRAKELQSNGQLIFTVLCIDEFERFSVKIPETYAAFIWKTMMEEGVITKSEELNTSCTSYYMTENELTSPFNDTTSKVYKAGLKLLKMKIKWSASEGSGAGDKTELRNYAKNFTLNFRVWSQSTFLCGLSPSRSVKEKQAIVDDFYRRFEDTVVKKTEDFVEDVVIAYMQIQKIATN